METQIHGVPTPPLGYRLASKGDAWIKGLQVWYPSEGSWQPSAMPKVDGLDADFIYAIPLNDGYEYFEAGTTVIQAGDEYRGAMSKEWQVIPCDWEGLAEVSFALRRPKAKPLSYLERQAQCGLKVGDRVKCVRFPTGGEYDGGYVRGILSLGEEGFITEIESLGEGHHSAGLTVRFDRNVEFVALPFFMFEKISPLAPGRNINGLTEADVGVADGWRLITEEELEKLPLDTEKLSSTGWRDSIYQGRRVAGMVDRAGTNYRTKAPLPGTKEVKRYFFGFGTIHSKDYLLSEGNAKLIENLLDALKEKKE